MMLRHILIFGLVSFTLAQSVQNTSKSPKRQPTEIKYAKASSAIDLKKQQFYSTKERPELNPVLSALINEDVKKSIDAKRHTEEYHPTTPNPVLTTVKPVHRVNDDSVVVDSMTGSSSDKKQTSRIEIKKGPNGVDYEYEYVYYYYDDDEKETNKKPSTTTAAPSRGNGKKNRHSSAEKTSTTTKPATASAERNEIAATRGRGRQSIPVVEEIAEERLPAQTRFPPRGSYTPSVQVQSSVEETTKKISVKRPSLELVDSQSFNRGEKTQSKGSRLTENEFEKEDAEQKEKDKAAILAAEGASGPVNVPSEDDDIEVTTLSNDEDTTTQVMDKVALDLYAHFANAGSNIDAVNNMDLEDATSSYADTETTTTDADDYTTLEPTTSTTTTTTTTTPEPTTTTTTTTTEAPQLINGRRPFGNGRNRLKANRPVAKSTTTEAPVEVKESAPVESSPLKPKNRFSRPSLSRSRTTTTVSPASEEAPIEKQEAKPVAASSPRGRPRNRFNLRGSKTTPPATEEKSPEENAIDTSPQPSSTQRSVRPRPGFGARGRARPGASTTTAPAENEEAANEQPEVQKSETEKPALKASSRFNLRRPNQLLGGRARASPLSKTTSSTEAPAEGAPANSENETPAEGPKDSTAEEHEQSSDETPAQPQTGLNRLRNRPRLQVQARAPTPRAASGTAALNPNNRKANPLLAKRKLGTSTTTETPAEGNVENDVESADANENTDENGKEEQQTEAPVEVSSEQPRGLSLLSRRKPGGRRPAPVQH